MPARQTSRQEAPIKERLKAFAIQGVLQLRGRASTVRQCEPRLMVSPAEGATRNSGFEIRPNGKGDIGLGRPLTKL